MFKTYFKKYVNNKEKCEMKKSILMLFSLFLIIGLVGCGEKNEKPTPTATSVLTAFKEAGLLIYKEVVFTAETDTNQLLGRPNSYIAKIDFNDKNTVDRLITMQKEEILKITDVPQVGFETDEDWKKLVMIERLGGTIEEFNNKEDTQKRFDYLESLQNSGLNITSNEYRTLQNNILLRIDSDVLPEQAKKYEETFKSLFEEINK